MSAYSEPRPEDHIQPCSARPWGFKMAYICHLCHDYKPQHGLHPRGSQLSNCYGCGHILSGCPLCIRYEYRKAVRCWYCGEKTVELYFKYFGCCRKWKYPSWGREVGFVLFEMEWYAIRWRGEESKKYGRVMDMDVEEMEMRREARDMGIGEVRRSEVRVCLEVLPEA